MYRQNTSFEIPETSKPLNQRRPRWYKKWWGKIIIGFILLLLAMVIAMGFYVIRVATLLRSGNLAQSDLFGTSSNVNLQEFNTLVTSDDPSFGPRDAKLVIVEFSDFQCPFCKQSAPVVAEIKKNYGDKVLFIYRDFPLTSIHPQALLGAMAGACAHEQGGFWPMHDLIFENQDKITPENLKRFSIQIGLNSLQFSNCLDSGKYLSEIEQDLQEGYDAGASATPTFFINGQPLAGAIPYLQFEQIILSELNR